MESIVFDLDDTLIPSSQFYKPAVELTGVDYRIYQSARDDVKTTILPGSTQKHSRLLYFKRYLELQGKFSASELLQLYASYENHLVNLLSSWAREESDRFQLLRGLQERGFKLYIATNETLQMQTLKLSIIDPMGDLFSGMLCSEEAGAEKPDPSFYSSLISRFSLRPELSYFIGDNEECDVLGPRLFGFTAYHLDDFQNFKHIVGRL